jgi:hypothetical protein
VSGSGANLRLVRRHAATALACAAALLALAGAGGLAQAVLLAAVVAAGVCVLDAVTERVAGRVTAGTVALAVVALATVVAAAAAHAPLLAVGACLGALRLPPLRQAEPVSPTVSPN